MKCRYLFFLIIAMLLIQGFTFRKAEDKVVYDETTKKIISNNNPATREAIYTYNSKTTKRKVDKIINKVVKLNHISAEKAVNIISRISPNLIVASKGIDVLILRSESSNINEALKVIKAIDKRPPQILIEGKIVEISESALENLGISWGREQGSFKFSIDPDSGNVSAYEDFVVTINALIGKGKANVLAHPKITTLDGKQADINIGSRIPYAVPANSSGTSTQWAVKYIDAGVSLKILSCVRSDGVIVSNIKPEVSSISEWRTTAAGEFPVISTRNADVTVKIKDGETLAIGGLISETERENISKIPLLADIPLLGGIFQRSVNERAKTEVVFLITPKIVD